jgi:GT2 family glycosyltransferase
MNAAIRVAKGDIHLRIDGHTLVDPKFISENVRVLLEHPDVCVSGGIMETVGATFLGRVIAAAMSNPVGVGGGNCRVGRAREGYVREVPFPAYWRRAYDKVGLYDETLVRNQDDDFVLRMNKAGLKYYMSPTIRSRYYSRASLRKLARQFYEYGFWRIRTLQKHKSPGQLRRVGPMVFVLLWLALIVGGFFWWPLRWALAGYAGLYLLALIVGAVTAGRRFGWVLAPLVPVAIAIMHFAYGLGSLKGIWSWVILRGRFVPPPEAHGTTR